VKKRFIEWDLPLAEISESSAKEKNIRQGHPSTLHIWWARKPLATCRALNFLSLIDLPDDNNKRNEIKKIVLGMLSWSSIKDSKNNYLIKAQKMLKNQWGSCTPKILDPFAGGGSIPLEALRLGCKTYASDYNPVATLIEKAIIEWPQKYNVYNTKNIKGIDGKDLKENILLNLLEKWGTKIQERVQEEIEKYYDNGSNSLITIGYVWARTIPCQNPNCSVNIPLMSQLWLSKSSNKNVAIKIKEINKKLKFSIVEGSDIDFNPNNGTISGGTIRCPACSQSFKSTEIRRLSLKGLLGEEMIAVITQNPSIRGKNYRIKTQEDEDLYKKSQDRLNTEIQNWPFLDNPLPDEEIRTPNKNKIKDSSGSFFVHLQPVLYDMHRYKDIFNKRQQLALIVFIKKIREAYNEILEDSKKLKDKGYEIDSKELAKAVMTYLGFGIDRLADFGSTLCVLNPTGGRGVVHTFGRQALQMSWNYAESNPFNPYGAGWPTACKKNMDIIDHLSKIENNSAEVTQSSALNIPYPDNFFDAIFTDPPYYDNVPYSDLSDFFYVWLKRSIGDLFPNYFATPLTPKNDECIENVSLMRRAKDLNQDEYKTFSIRDKNDFNNLLGTSFTEIYRVLKKDGIATIVYAHKTTDGWETMLNSLIDAGLVVTASWPIHTEMKARLRAVSSAALASSIYMVCRKIEREKVGFYSELKPKIKKRIEKKLEQFWNEGISGGDFFISAIGPGMEIFSQFKRVEKLSGEQVTTSELLEYIRTVSTDFIVNKLLKDSSSAKIDKESEFYLAYRWTYLDNTVEFDDARKLASASGVNLEKLWTSSGFVKKSGSKITVLGPKNRDKFEQLHSMVDVMHKSVLLWEKGDRTDLSKLLLETGYGKDPAFKQFCQAVAETLLNGNKEKQLLEGFLIGIDAYTRGKAKTPKDQTDLKQFGGN